MANAFYQFTNVYGTFLFLGVCISILCGEDLGMVIYYAISILKLKDNWYSTRYVPHLAIVPSPLIWIPRNDHWAWYRFNNKSQYRYKNQLDIFSTHNLNSPYRFLNGIKTNFFSYLTIFFGVIHPWPKRHIKYRSRIGHPSTIKVAQSPADILYTHMHTYVSGKQVIAAS